MFTQCPHCHAIYRVTAETLAAGRGRVQCGDCEQTFDALPGLRDELPAAQAHWENTELPFSAPEASFDAGTGEDGGHAGDELREAMDAPRERPPPAGGPPAWPGSERRLSRFWPAASLLLGAVLVAQIVFLVPSAVAGHESLRPVASVLCRLSGCELPPRQALDQLRLASRDVRAHPSVPGALIISATLVNGASFTQAYPVLEISLGNLQGDQVALRRFPPSAYLPESVDISEGMAPDARVQVSLEVVDPGEAAVAFRFAFRSAGR